MKSPICDMLGIEFPLLAFSHCRDVVAAVSRAGGFGVLGGATFTPESLDGKLTPNCVQSRRSSTMNKTRS